MVVWNNAVLLGTLLWLTDSNTLYQAEEGECLHVLHLRHFSIGFFFKEILIQVKPLLLPSHSLCPRLVYKKYSYV